MSASKDKKRRQEERSSGLTENRASQETLEQAKTRKKYRTISIIVIVAIVVAIVFCIVFGSNLLYNKAAAVRINDEEYSVADFNFFYFTEYNKYYSEVQGIMGDYASMMMPDTSKPFREQIQDTDTGITWAEFLQERTLESMKEVAMLCDEAEKAGVSLSDEDIASIDSEVSNLQFYASYAGYSSADGYLEYLYGKGMTEEIYRKNLERATLATVYSEFMLNSFEYDEQAVSDYYNEHSDDYDYISYRSFYLDGNAVADNEETEEDETVSAEDAMANAKKTAELVKKQTTDEERFVELTIENAQENMKKYYEDDPDFTLQSTKGEELPETYKEWLLDPAREYGDVEVFEYHSSRPEELDEDANYMESNGYYVVFYVERDDNDYLSANGEYLQISPDSLTKSDYETDEEYEAAKEEADRAAADKANELLEAWNSEDAEYESLLDLTSEFYGYATSSGTYDQINKNEVYDAIADWMFNPARKEGDVEVVYVDYYGYYLLKFDGNGDTCKNVMADADMRSNDYDARQEELVSNYTLSTTGIMRYTKKMTALGG